MMLAASRVAQRALRPGAPPRLEPCRRKFGDRGSARGIGLLRLGVRGALAANWRAEGGLRPDAHPAPHRNPRRRLLTHLSPWASPLGSLF